jgi:hypothetical protein
MARAEESACPRYCHKYLRLHVACQGRLAELGYSERSMGGSAIDPLPKQTYALIRTAVIGRLPIAVVYHSRPRLVPHTDWVGIETGGRKYCAISTAVRVTAGYGR